MPRGGKRPGAGAKPRGVEAAHNVSIRLTETELAQLDAYVAKHGRGRSHWVRLAMVDAGLPKLLGDRASVSVPQVSVYTPETATLEGERDQLRAELALSDRNAREWEAREAKATEELEKTRAELEACKRNRDLFRTHQLSAEAEATRVGRELAARREQHEALRAAALDVVFGFPAGEPWSDAEARLAALLKPAPAESMDDWSRRKVVYGHDAPPVRGWQHISSDGESHTFRRGSEERTLEGFTTAAEAAKCLDGLAEADAEPVKCSKCGFSSIPGQPAPPYACDCDADTDTVQRPPPEQAMVSVPVIPTDPAADSLVDGLMHDAREREQAMVPASLQSLWDEVERVKCALRTFLTAWSGDEPRPRAQAAKEALEALDARRGA